MISIRPPLNTFWSVTQKATVLAIFIFKIFDEDIHIDKASSKATQFIKSIVARYELLQHDKETIGLVDVLKQKSGEISINFAMMQHFESHIVPVAAELRDILSKYDNEAIVQIELGNYIEDITNFLLDTTLVLPFFVQFVSLN